MSPKVRMTRLKGLGILELPQVKRQRLFQYHDVDTLAQLRAQQRLGKRDAALCHGGGGDQYGLECHILHHLGERRCAGRAVQFGGMDDGIDDLRTDIGDRRGQYAGNQREYGEGDAERFVGGPDQVQRAAAIGEYSEQAAPQPARIGCRRRRGFRLGLTK
jgi:hypothetical protein